MSESLLRVEWPESGSVTMIAMHLFLQGRTSNSEYIEILEVCNVGCSGNAFICAMKFSKRKIGAGSCHLQDKAVEHSWSVWGSQGKNAPWFQSALLSSGQVLFCVVDKTSAVKLKLSAVVCVCRALKNSQTVTDRELHLLTHWAVDCCN